MFTGGRGLGDAGWLSSGIDFPQVETFLPVPAPCIPAGAAGPELAYAAGAAGAGAGGSTLGPGAGVLWLLLNAHCANCPDR